MQLYPSQLYALLLTASAVLSAFAWGIAQRRRKQPGVNDLLIFLTGTLIWSLTYALHWTAVSPDTRRFWLNATYLGVVIVAPSMFLYILNIMQPGKAPKKGKSLLFYVIPAITLFLLVTDGRWGLFYGGKPTIGQSRIFDGGPGFWLNLVYMYTLILLGFTLLAMSLRRPNRLQRAQALILLAGLSFPVGANLMMWVVMSATGSDPFIGLDITPMAFTFTGLILTYGLLNQRLLGLLSIGRDILMEQMKEGILLVDAERRILDWNPAARLLLDLPEGDLTGMSLDAALSERPEVSRLMYQDAAITKELALLPLNVKPGSASSLAGEMRYLNIQITPLIGAGKRLGGMAAICHDITRRKVFELSLQSHISRIEALQQDLRDQATRDPLTGVFNRRYFQDTLPRELARAARDGTPLSIVMLDLDHFKSFNDTYGHQAGDLLLQRLAQVLTTNTRRGDVVARFGGEEFLVALPESSPDAARKRAEQWRTEFGGCAVPYENQLLQITVSAGLASYPGDGTTLDELVRKADAALYLAKAAGRNRVVAYG